MHEGVIWAWLATFRHFSSIKWGFLMLWTPRAAIACTESGSKWFSLVRILQNLEVANTTAIARDLPIVVFGLLLVVARGVTPDRRD